ncbi:MAG TPA: hypothetical protein DCM05_13805 [Elusimicrobia bacterium]|nr:hypothetical protein [Elusimicrobiota bacterium]
MRAALLLCALAAAAETSAPRDETTLALRLDASQSGMTRQMDELTPLLQRLESLKASYCERGGLERFTAERAKLSAEAGALLESLGSNRKDFVQIVQLYDGVAIAEAARGLRFKGTRELLRGSGSALPGASASSAARFLSAGRWKLFEGQVSSFESKARAALDSERAAFEAAEQDARRRARVLKLALAAALVLAAGAVIFLLRKP